MDSCLPDEVANILIVFALSGVFNTDQPSSSRFCFLTSVSLPVSVYKRRFLNSPMRVFFALQLPLLSCLLTFSHVCSRGLDAVPIFITAKTPCWPGSLRITILTRSKPRVYRPLRNSSPDFPPPVPNVPFVLFDPSYVFLRNYGPRHIDFPPASCFSRPAGRAQNLRLQVSPFPFFALFCESLPCFSMPCSGDHSLVGDVQYF